MVVVAVAEAMARGGRLTALPAYEPQALVWPVPESALLLNFDDKPLIRPEH